MKSRLNLKAGQDGTKKLVEKYGNALLYVRYRYDEVKGLRLRTVELIDEAVAWQPTLRIRKEEMVPVNVYFTEKDLREKLKVLGGKWHPEEKSWFVTYGAIRGTELEERIPEGFLKDRRRR
jgi:hypothetical protein